jgi:hypothetical protein
MRREQARSKAYRAYQQGILINPGKCSECGGKEGEPLDGTRTNYCNPIKLQMHHRDYRSPLKVDWVCQSCHMIIHRDRRDSWFQKPKRPLKHPRCNCGVMTLERAKARGHKCEPQRLTHKRGKWCPSICTDGKWGPAAIARDGKWYPTSKWSPVDTTKLQRRKSGHWYPRLKT